MNSKVYKSIFLLIGIFSLGYLVYGIGLGEIWLNIRKTGIWFIPVIGSWLLIYILNAFAFNSIIEEPGVPQTRLPFLLVLRLTITGYAINYVTPFVALGGEPYRILELKPRLGIHKASSAVLLYSLMHMFSHVLFWLVSIGLILAFVPINNIVLVGCILMLLVSLILGFWFIRVYKKGFTVSTVNLLSKLPFVKKKAIAFAKEKSETLHEIDSQIRILYSDRKARFFSSLTLEFVARVVGCLEIYFTAIAIGLNMSLTEALIVSSASSLFANLVFFFPMQLGTREGGLAMALQSVGLAAAGGIFIGVVMRIREIFWIVIGMALMPKKKVRTPKERVEDQNKGRLTYAHSVAQSKNAW